MILLYMLADTTPTPSAQNMGEWFYALCAVGACAACLGSLLSYFATRREVDRLDIRVANIEAELPEMERRLDGKGEARASRIHKRIDRVGNLCLRIAGKLNVASEPEATDD